MAQIFHPSLNVISKVSIFGFVIFVGSTLLAVRGVERSSYMTQAQVPVEQPVPFSHKHHVSALGIDCRYCHTGVETSHKAGVPATRTCMTCHSQIWKEAPMLEPVRKSFREDRSIAWVRVHDLPDFVYFNHSIHVTAGVGCESCHGRVDQMPLTWRENSLYMEWCLDCHRAPEEHLRPRDQVFVMGWTPPDDQLVVAERLKVERGIDPRRLDDCSVCHR